MLRPPRLSRQGPLLCLVAAVVGLGPACKPASEPDSELRVAVGYDLGTLDPHASNSFEALEQMSNVYDSLVALDGSLRLVPSLAESWSNPDPLTWSFRLRPGVRFHDGSLLTPEDVVYSVTRLKADASLAVRSQLSAVSGAAVENGDVVIRTARPSARLLNELSQVAIVRAGATGEALDRSPNGTGPWAAQAWSPGQPLRLRRHEGYWGRRPAFARVEVEMGVSEAYVVAGLGAGRLSLAAHLGGGGAPGAEKAAAGDARYRVVRQPSIFVRHLGFDVASPTLPGAPTVANPFRKREVREAIDLALDRRLIAEAVSPYASPAHHIVSSFVFGYDSSLTGGTPDLLRARELLATAGYRNGLDLTLHQPRGKDPASAELVAQLARVGIRVAIVTAPTTSAFFQALSRGELALWTMGDGGMTGEAGALLAAAFHSTDPERSLGLENYSGGSDPELDRLIDESDATFSPALRRPLLQAAVRRAEEQLWWIPLYRADAPFIVAREVAFEPRADLLLRYAAIGRVRP